MTTRLITGANRGLGFEVARQLVAAGHQVWIGARDDAPGELAADTTKAAEKRKKHGSKGAVVFRDPFESDRVWGIFDWDEQGWQSFVSDPDVRPILPAAGVKGKLHAAELVGSVDA